MLKNKLFVVLYFLLHDFGFVLYLLWPLEKCDLLMVVKGVVG